MYFTMQLYNIIVLQCTKPAFAGDGVICGLDSDSDGRPDVQLNCADEQCTKVQIDLCNNNQLLVQLTITNTNTGNSLRFNPEMKC